jgi:hypothetical protein
MIVMLKWWLAYKHYEQKNAKTPNVDRLSEVWLLLKHFRWRDKIRA